MAGRTQILVRFGYRGDRFRGLQPQGGRSPPPTAGGALRERLAAAAEARPRGLAFAARTDAGVHALANIATCFFRPDRETAEVPRPAAHIVADVVRPRDDGLLAVEALEVPVSVHARGGARGKHYRYRFVDGASPADDVAVERPDAWSIAPRLDEAQMQAAALQLLGRRDFSSLRGGGCTARSPEKNLSTVDVRRDVDGSVTLDVVGDAFLRKMMRNMAGLLAEVGAGLRRADDVTRVLAARHRTAAGVCAPAHGLTLVAVGFAWPPDGRWLLPAGSDPAGGSDDDDSTG